MEQQKSILIGNEHFYYNEEKLYWGRKTMDSKIATENLQIFHSIMEKSGLTYGLFFGTLLGAIRERNFIAHDEDIDIYALDEEREKLLALLTQLKTEGLEVVRYDADMISIMRKNEYIDIYFFKARRKFGLFKVRIVKNRFEYGAKNMENPVKRPFLGMNFPMPDNAEELLVKLYGKNWHIPLKGKPCEPNTIYNQISKLGSAMKGLPFYDKLELMMKKLLKKLGI